MKSGMIRILLPLLFTLSAHADRSWNDANNPANLGDGYSHEFFRLPLKGSITDSNKGWSDSYWPATRGYIADRWQVPSLAFKFKDYELPEPSALYLMSSSQLNLLSPAEKFDIIRNQLEFPLMKRLQKANPTDADWWRGLCNGWTQASLHFDEPKPILFRSPRNGIVVPFGSSDIKALLAYYYAQIDRTSYDSENKFQGYIGRACRLKDRVVFDATGACSDINAGAFHIALTNEMGIRHEGMAMDRDPDTQVWNQPFVGYETKILEIKTADLSKKKTEGTVKEVKVSTTVKYVNELYSTHDPLQENDHNVAPQYQALGKGNQRYGSAEYIYILELDAGDRIIGGEWTFEGDRHPDFIWKQPFNPNGLAQDTLRFKEDWVLLDAIVKQATSY